jgi:hypothetical protein
VLFLLDAGKVATRSKRVLEELRSEVEECRDVEPDRDH